MPRQTPNPSVTSRARTDNTHWMTLVLYVAVTALVFGHALWSIPDPGRSPYSFVNGVALTAVAVGSLFAYMAVFKDSIHVFHSESDWEPSWSKYFALGFGVPLACYALIVLTDSFVYATPLVLVAALDLSTALMASVYLYQRHRHVGLP